MLLYLFKNLNRLTEFFVRIIELLNYILPNWFGNHNPEFEIDKSKITIRAIC